MVTTPTAAALRPHPAPSRRHVLPNHGCRNNVETHGVNFYLSLLNATLGAHLPYLPIYWENWPHSTCDFWNGLSDRCWEACGQ